MQGNDAQGRGLFMNLHRETIKRIDKKALEMIQATRPLDGITKVLGSR